MQRIKLVPYSDYEQLLSLLNDCDCYAPMSYKDVVGVEFYGAYHDDVLVACVMVLVVGPQAFIDYLCVHKLYQHEGVATALLDHVKVTLEFKKVRTVHAAIASINEHASKLVGKFGCTIGWPYINVLASLVKE